MKNRAEKIILNIAPLARISLSGSQCFSYVSEKRLSPGTLVKIPLFNRIIDGIVIEEEVNIEKSGKYQLKKIFQVAEIGHLTENQLNLARQISDYYLCPLGVVLKFFVVRRAKSRSPQPMTCNQVYKKIILTKEQKGAVDKIINKNNWKLEIGNWKFLLLGPSGSGKTEVYINAVKKLKVKSPKSQFLILLPELTLTPQAIDRYSALFKPEEIAVINSRIPKGKLFEYWEDIRTGKIKLIIGTRMAVFAPFQSLALVVVDEEQDISFKQWDMNPRYDARTVATILSDIFGSRLVLGTSTPRIETYYSAMNNIVQLIKLPELWQQDESRFQKLETKIVTADMKKGYAKDPKNDLSPSLLSEINYALKYKKQALIFINRKGMSNFSVCASCGKLMTCPKCDRALLMKNDGNYYCPHCAYQSGIFWKCGKCGSMKGKNIGTGTQKVEKQLKLKFPRHVIETLDATTSKTKGKISQVYKDFMAGKIDILIGTQMITKGWDNPRLEVVGIIDADNLFSLPDIFADQMGFNNIMQVIGRTSRPNSQRAGTVVIQTYKPESPIYKHVAERNYASFFEEEINKRKVLGYPPFKKIIKLVCRGKSQELVEKESKKLYDILELRAAGLEISLTVPYWPLVPKTRNLYHMQMLIRFSGALDKDVKKIIAGLGSSWIVDVDPITTS